MIPPRKPKGAPSDTSRPFLRRFAINQMSSTESTSAMSRDSLLSYSTHVDKMLEEQKAEISNLKAQLETKERLVSVASLLIKRVGSLALASNTVILQFRSPPLSLVVSFSRHSSLVNRRRARR